MATGSHNGANLSPAGLATLRLLRCVPLESDAGQEGDVPSMWSLEIVLTKRLVSDVTTTPVVPDIIESQSWSHVRDGACVFTQ